MEVVVLAHGGGSGPIDMLVGIAPVLLGVLMLGVFVTILGMDRVSGADEGVRDETPSPARQMFDGEYPWTMLMLKSEVESALEPVERELAEKREPIG